MMLDREQESLALSLELTDPSIPLVARARDLEAARTAVLAAGDAADGATYDAMEVVPTTLGGVRDKLAMALDIEGRGWLDDVTTLVRSLLASPTLAVVA